MIIYIIAIGCHGIKEVDPPVPQGHSFFYPGLHYVFFEVVNWMGIDNPKTQMVLVRLIHALLSLWTILISFKITEKLSSSKVAKTVGLAIALGWAMPFYSVRNLVEIVCIPFYLYGIWQLVKHDFKDEWKTLFYCWIIFWNRIFCSATNGRILSRFWILFIVDEKMER